MYSLCTRMTTLCLVLTQMAHVHLSDVLTVVFAVILTFTFCNENRVMKSKNKFNLLRIVCQNTYNNATMLVVTKTFNPTSWFRFYVEFYVFTTNLLCSSTKWYQVSLYLLYLTKDYSYEILNYLCLGPLPVCQEGYKIKLFQTRFYASSLTSVALPNMITKRLLVCVWKKSKTK